MAGSTCIREREVYLLIQLKFILIACERAKSRHEEGMMQSGGRLVANEGTGIYLQQASGAGQLTD